MMAALAKIVKRSPEGAIDISRAATTLCGAGDLARRAGILAGAWALKRPDTSKVSRAVAGQLTAQAV
jgi:hypothetical protein